MKVFEYLDRISMMHKLVSRQVTGTPEEFARRLGVSRTSLYEMIDELRSRGAPIIYSKSTKTFSYRQPYDIAVTCSLRPLTGNEEKESSGGCNINMVLKYLVTDSVKVWYHNVSHSRVSGHFY